jgi:hypothetical protein
MESHPIEDYILFGAQARSLTMLPEAGWGSIAPKGNTVAF